MSDGAVALNMRWIKMQATDATVPAYGCVEVVDTVLVDDELVVKVKTPSDDDLDPSSVMFNLNCEIPSGEYGMGTYSFPTWAIGASTYGVGQTLGTRKDRHVLGFGAGFICEGVDGGRIRVKPHATKTAACVPDNIIYSRRYECDHNPHYIDPADDSYADPENSTEDCCDHTNPRGYLNEYLDYYEWNEQFCDWILHTASGPNRRIACCDPRCDDDSDQPCEPCDINYIRLHDEPCCGKSFNMDVYWACGSYDHANFKNEAMPTETWLEMRTHDPVGTWTEIASTRYFSARGFRSHRFQVTIPCDAGGLDQKINLRVAHRVKGCGDGDIRYKRVDDVFLLIEECAQPKCDFCPDNAGQANDVNPAQFGMVGTLTGSPSLNETRVFEYDWGLGYWVAHFDDIVEADSLTGELITFSFYAVVECLNDDGSGQVGFAAPDSSAIRCSPETADLGGSEIDYDSIAQYGTNLTATNFTAKAITDHCQSDTFPNNTNLTLSIAIGNCEA